MPKRHAKPKKHKEAVKRISSRAITTPHFLLRHFSFILIITGIILMSTALWWQDYSRSILSFSSIISAPIPTPNPITTKPIRIRIPSTGIDLPITEAKVVNNVWEVTTAGANHWDTSGNPGDTNNIVIYAHNWKTLFGPLLTVREGEHIELTDETGKLFTYEITQTVSVKPNQVEYIQPTDDETLTLYTCTGFLDSMRFMVIAKPIKK